MARRVGVWLEGDQVAQLETRGGVDLRLRYTKDAQARWPTLTPVVSCSLPLRAGWHDALPFARGLLPEGRALATMARAAGVAENATFELLRRYGRDVAGALVIADDPPEAARQAAVPYVPGELDAAVAELDTRPLALHDDSELSLAGFEDKLVLVETDDGWARPIGGLPSTHILKRDNARHPGVVVAEAAALAMARGLGLTTIDPQLTELGGTPCVIVPRFDRRRDADGRMRRIHQEDLCQAAGVDPDGARGRAKYEAEGGPGFRTLAGLLRAYADDPTAQLIRLVRALVFTVLIGNADAHAKNLALLHPRPGTVELAPLYDTVPTVLWPALKDRAAMLVGGRDRLSEVTLEDLGRETRTWRVPRSTATSLPAFVEEAMAAAEDCGHADLAAEVAARGRRLLST